MHYCITFLQTHQSGQPFVWSSEHGHPKSGPSASPCLASFPRQCDISQTSPGRLKGTPRIITVVYVYHITRFDRRHLRRKVPRHQRPHTTTNGPRPIEVFLRPMPPRRRRMHGERNRMGWKEHSDSLTIRTSNDSWKLHLIVIIHCQ